MKSTYSLYRPIFIIGCHKSGSSLLRALLDDHPKLAVVPREAHFFEILGSGVQYPIRASDPAPLHHADQRLLQTFTHESGELDPYSDSPSFSGYSHERLLHMSNTLRWESAQEALKDYLEGLYEAANGEYVHGRRIVEKSVENAEFIPTLDQLTHEASFIAIVRNPYANFVALRRQKSYAGTRYPFARPLIESLRHHYMALTRARIGGYANILTLRYEDLVTNIESVMQEVMTFLDEPWTDSLLHPSERGEPWASNSTWTRGFQVSTTSLHSWRKDIHSFEIGLVNSYLEPLIREHGYERLQSPSFGRWLLPNRKEYPRNWLLNRVTTAERIRHGRLS